MSTKRKAPGKLAPPTVRSSAKLPTKTAIDESRTSVADTEVLPSSQQDAIEISSDEPSDEDLSDDEDEEEPQTNGAVKMNGVTKTSQLPSPGLSGAREEEDDDEGTSPSFGELLRGNDAIDVPALLKQDSTTGALAQPARTPITPPAHQSLTTVLTQALRTDDTELLESCLHTTDLPTIRNTIENIDSTLAGTLLGKLASRLHRRPGRAGSLMTWVQWTLIAHGGSIASQPKVIQSLGSLQKVLSERAKGLNSLLALKGKLDLLEGQMDMRRKMQRKSSLAHPNSDFEDDEDVIWVEGEHDKGSPHSLSNSRKRGGAADSDDDEPVMNGVMGDSSDEEDDEVEEDEDSEDAEESLDEDEVDHDDVDESMGEEEDSDVEAAPPSKMQKVGKAFGKRK